MSIFGWIFVPNLLWPYWDTTSTRMEWMDGWTEWQHRCHVQKTENMFCKLTVILTLELCPSKFNNFIQDIHTKMRGNSPSSYSCMGVGRTDNWSLWLQWLCTDVCAEAYSVNSLPLWVYYSSQSISLFQFWPSVFAVILHRYVFLCNEKWSPTFLMYYSSTCE